MSNPSPLRYPGGKNRLSAFIALVIKDIGLQHCTYIEPFAGGAGVALSLLLDGTVENIIINDYDKSIYSFWRAVKEDHQNLIDLIDRTPITIEEWHHQKEIYSTETTYSLDLAFATLFLNRTNRSGILNAGPIGGYAQDGDWKLDVRFDKEKIIAKILEIAKHRNNIRVYNKDIISLLRNYSHTFGENVFYYFDPPYYKKGQKLYKNFFVPKDHQRIHDIISREITAPWIVTYDDIPEIEELYSDFYTRRFSLTYSAANKGVSSELMFFSNREYFPSEDQLKKSKITISFEGV